MFGSEVIDVGIGMTLLFLFMSLIATALRELIENFVKLRARSLELGIKELLQDNNNNTIVKNFYEHPLIFSLYPGAYSPGQTSLPSYIPRESFALALLDIVAKASSTGSVLSLETLRTELSGIQQPNGVQRVVLTAIGTAQGDLDKVRKTLEDWYDGTMDRVSGWYTRRTGRWLGCIGLIAAILLNVDAITVVERLTQDKNLRETAVSRAEQRVSAPSPGEASHAPASGSNDLKDVANLADTFDKIGFPIGWTMDHGWIYPTPQSCTLANASNSSASSNSGAPRCSYSLPAILNMLIGWAVTALAIMLGAPFWFDVLNKFMVVRSTIKPNEKSPDEASADAQPGSARPLQAGTGVTVNTGAISDGLAPDQIMAASIASAVAVQGGAFVPHSWANDPNPQRGVM